MNTVRQIVLASPQYALWFVIVVYVALALFWARSRAKHRRLQNRRNLNPPCFHHQPYRE